MILVRDGTQTLFKITLSAPGGGEGRGEAGDTRASTGTPLTLPVAAATGPLPIPRKRAERPILSIIAAIAVLVAAIAHAAAPPRAEDPDWPCQQRLVPHLSAAAYW